MMKKTFAAFACAVISLSLAACGNNSTGQEKNNGSSLSASRTTETTNQEETKVTNKEYVFNNYEGTYTGDWKDGVPNGNGVFISEGNVTIGGEWLNGNMNGQATIEYADGAVCSGNYLNNKLNGKGSEKYINEDGEYIFEGTYNNGVFSSGTYTVNFADGSTVMYQGDMDSGGNFISGTMTITLADGATCVSQGNFDNELRLTSGTEAIIYTDGYSEVISDGVWNNGTLVSGTKTITYVDGSSIVAQGEWNSEGKFYNGIYIIYNSDASKNDSGTVTNGNWVSDFDKMVGDIIDDVVNSAISDLREDHPVIGGVLDYLYNY